MTKREPTLLDKSNPLTDFKKDLLVGCLLALLTAFFYIQIISDNRFFFPYDSKDQFYPNYFHVFESYKNGEVPLWNPYVFSGMPSFADPSFFTFNPIHIICSFILPYLDFRIFDIIEIFHIFLGGLFVYFLSLEFRLDRISALVAGCVYMLGGVMSGHVQHVPSIYTSTYFPLAFLFLKRYMDTNSVLFATYGGIVSALMILSSQGHVVYLMFLSFVAYIIFHYVAIEKTITWRNFYRKLGLSAIFFGIAVGLAAIQIVPTMEFLKLSYRANIDFAAATSGSFSPATLINLLLPNFYGHIELVKGKYWGLGDPVETYFYFGIFPLVLTILGIFYPKNKNRFLFTGLFIASLFYIMAKYTAFYKGLYVLVPGISKFKRPSDGLYVLQMGIAILSGFGSSMLFPPQNTEERIKKCSSFLLSFMKYVGLVVFGIFIAQVFYPNTRHLLRDLIGSLTLFLMFLMFSYIVIKYSISHNMSTKVLSVSIVGLVVFDLFSFNSHNRLNTSFSEIPLISKESIYGDFQTISFFKNDPDFNKNKFFRIESPCCGSLWLNGGMLWKIQSLGEYGPLFLSRYNEFIGVNYQRERSFNKLVKSYDSKLFDLLNVKYIVATSAADLQKLNPNSKLENFNKVYASWHNWYWVYENKDFLPRAFIVDYAKVVKDGDEAKAELLSHRFDPTAYVVIENEQGIDTSNFPEKPSKTIIPTTSKASIVNYSAREIVVKTLMRKKGFLFLSEVYYPGWKVFIDGVESKVLHTNYLFRSVFLDKGFHTVRFFFDPLSFKIGYIITFSTLFLVLIAITIGCIQKARKKQECK